MTSDTPSRAALKKRAHQLKAIIQTGAAGMSDAVIAEIDQALTAHELVKIKVAGDNHSARTAMVDRACSALGARCVARIGHTATLYRAQQHAQPGGRDHGERESGSATARRLRNQP